MALGLALAVLPAATFIGARPALTFIARNRELLSKPLDGIFLMVPVFELTITAAWLAAGIGLLLLFGTKDRLFPRAYAVMLTVQLGLLVSSHQALAITRLATEPLAGEIPIAQDHLAAVEAAAHNLVWVFAAYAVLVPVVFLTRAVRTRFAGDCDRPRLADERVMTVPPAPVRVAQASFASTRVEPGPGPAGGGFLQGNRYFIQATYLGGPFGGLLQVRDLDLNRAFVAWIAPLRLRSVVQVFADRQRKTEILRIEARQVLSLGGWYDVFDSSNQEKIAVVGKRFAADWRIHDRLDQPIGIITRGDGSLGRATYHACLGPHEVGTLMWSNVLKPALEIDYSADVDGLLDRRLAVALGLLLFIDLSIPGP